MKDPRSISIQDFTYSLPEERIAKYPLAERDASKLLIYKKGEITEDIYRNISDHLPKHSLLVFNNTKVVEARLLFKKSTGGVIEIFCLEPHEQYTDITTAMLQKGKVFWQCLVGGASKWKPGQVLEKKISSINSEIILQAKYIEKKTGSFIIELSWSPMELSFAEVLHLAGAIPLPPYIKRPVEESDKERYQTVYAESGGSVAAPTAGLHFTNNVFDKLKKKNIQTDFVTLHVGAGTFKPVKSETMQEHAMHAEWIDVSKNVIEHILNNLDNNIIAVGTTSLRTIESLYWIGRKPELRSGSRKSEQSSDIQVSQWEAYELNEKNVPVKDALQSLLDWMTEQKLERLVTKTQILIAPGYEFKIVKGLITNFHQPQSTLLLLVAALIGNNPPAGQAGWKDVYDHALQNDFRFLSYGDGCLLCKNDA
ncbi:MAG: S-adenosylmethionine:tRNA ribosyltransferase-isomerase [Chitinophagaceae bacterium]|nr:S-adenosylmethionine:tRNA ribosyltransferase-isomerase [Chitinophagaceae bacterium]